MFSCGEKKETTAIQGTLLNDGEKRYILILYPQADNQRGDTAWVLRSFLTDWPGSGTLMCVTWVQQPFANCYVPIAAFDTKGTSFIIWYILIIKLYAKTGHSLTPASLILSFFKIWNFGGPEMFPSSVL